MLNSYGYSRMDLNYPRFCNIVLRRNSFSSNHIPSWALLVFLLPHIAANNSVFLGDLPKADLEANLLNCIGSWY